MMNSSLFRWLFGTTDAPYSIFLRISVGLIFSTQGFLKYVDPNLGVNRFTKIGFPYPDFTAHFVVAFEMVCGVLVLLGIWTRAAAIPLLIVNLTAIASTRFPSFGNGARLLVHGYQYQDRLCDAPFASIPLCSWQRTI
jgi:putative oxidoreductase